MSLIIDNKVVETPIKDLVELLRQQLAVSHIDKLNHIEYKQHDIRITCPFHIGHGEGGHERTPSCDILLEDKGDLPAGSVHCFGCGYKASFLKFVADCLDINYRKAAEWILGVSKYSLLETSRDIEDLSLLDNKNDKKEVTEVTLDELRSYDFIHPYMFERKLNDDIIEKFEVGYDPKLDALTFPVYVDGKCLFVAKRRVKFKRFDMPKLSIKPIYGLDYVRSKEVIVCESIINALTCWAYGREAIALFGTGSISNYEQLNKSDIRSYILMFDGDKAGRAGAERFKKNIKNGFISDIVLPENKDVNDLSKEEFDKLLDTVCYF